VITWILDVTVYLWLVWLVIVVAAVVIELITLEFTFLMVGAGSLVGGLGLNLLGAPWWAQVVGAAVVTALLLLLVRPVVIRTVGRNDQLIPTNVDALAGMAATVVDDFSTGRGFVKLRNGETWSAVAEGATSELRAGAEVRVLRIEGATAVVSVGVVIEGES
jgi:membrane protein implicated in regulation of membrane protease activity